MVALVASIIPLVALFQVFDGLSAVGGGIFRTRGQQVCKLLGVTAIATDIKAVCWGYTYNCLLLFHRQSYTC